VEPPTQIVKFPTPDKLLLNGLWFGPDKSKKVFIFIHGLTGSFLSGTGLNLFPHLIAKGSSVLSFNNRGHDIVARIKKIDKRKKKGYSSQTLGMVFEKFTDCVFDIQGAINFAKARGAKEIFLMGHSTGSQKSVYYLSRKGRQKQVKGVILLSPMSDYAGSLKENGQEKIKEAVSFANKLIKKNTPNELLPTSVWPYINSAQRFLSLNTPDSEEEIFCYAHPNKKPVTLRKIKIPILIVLAGKDEHRDRPIKQIAKWFSKNLRRKNATVKTVESADHSFTQKEREVAGIINPWVASL